MKYLAWLNWAFIAITVIIAPLWGKIAAIVSVLNFLLFFGPDIIKGNQEQEKCIHEKGKFLQAA